MACFMTLVSALASLLCAVIFQQVNGGAIRMKDDPIYDTFREMILLQQQLDTAKINLTIEVVENATSIYNGTVFSDISSNLTACLVAAEAQYPDADPLCVQDVQEEVTQQISDSQAEFQVCANLSNSWDKVGDLLSLSYDALQSLDDVVNNILVDALACVKKYPKNPSKRYACMEDVQKKYSDAWNNATSQIHVATNHLSGLDLLLTIDVNSCDFAEEATLSDKCAVIFNDVKACTSTFARPSQ